jgi:hypothetical protein
MTRGCNPCHSPRAYWGGDRAGLLSQGVSNLDGAGFPSSDSQVRPSRVPARDSEIGERCS